MFCDLVGSTELSLRLDPEDLHEVIQMYRDAVQEVLSHWEGVIARYLGDGLLIYFGYPTAHEDDPKRAVHAALDIRNAIAELPNLNLPDGLFPLQIHIGIHTGVVIAGDLGSESVRETSGVLGSVPNLAARLQDRAGPGEIFLSGDTASLVVEDFELESLGPVQLKGFEKPLDVIRVVTSRPRAALFEGRQNQTPFVGRLQELRVIEKLWNDVEKGRGHVVCIKGEAGVGKSRFVREVKVLLGSRCARWSVFHCEPQARYSAFYPFADRIGRDFALPREEARTRRFDRIRRAVREEPDREAAAIDLALLLGVEIPSRHRPVDLTPQVIRRRILSFILDCLTREADRGPMVVVIEDIHWADDSTLEVLSLLAPQTTSVPILLIVTHRPDFAETWLSRGYITNVTLRPLVDDEARRMVEPLTQEARLSGAVVSQILEKAGGNPLFLEEFVKSVEASAGNDTLGLQAAPLVVPITLRDSLMARLDGLGDVKWLLQTAAVLGQLFTYSLLSDVSGLDQRLIRPQIAKLVAQDLLVQHGVLPDAKFTFKHALIQDFAYETILRRDRQALHRRVAQHLASAQERQEEVQPGILAWHYSMAGDWELAARYWLEAGQLSGYRSANREAMAQIGTGLEALEHFPQEKRSERIRMELDLRMTLAAPLLALSGWSSPTVEDNYLRAQNTAQELKDEERLFDVLRGLFNVYLLRAEMPKALATADMLMEKAQQGTDKRLFLEAQRSRGVYRFFTSDFQGAQSDLRAVMEIYDAEKHRSHAYVYGAEPGVVAKVYLAWIDWFDKREDQALQEMSEALKLGDASGHPFSQGYAFCFAASLYQSCGQIELTKEFAARAVALADEHSFPYWSGWGKILEGWSIAVGGNFEHGQTRLQEGLRDYQETGSRLILGYALCLLGEIESRIGRIDEAAATLAEARQEMTQRGTKFYLDICEKMEDRLRTDGTLGDLPPQFGSA